MAYQNELEFSDLTEEEQQECCRISKLYKANQTMRDAGRNYWRATVALIVLSGVLLPVLSKYPVVIAPILVFLLFSGYLFSNYLKSSKDLPGVSDIPQNVRDLGDRVYKRMSKDYGCSAHERLIFHEAAECSQEEYESTIYVWQKGKLVDVKETIFNTDRIWCPLIDIDKYRTPVEVREDVIYYDYTEFLKQLIVHYMAILKRIPDRNQEALPPTIYNVSHALCDILNDENENFLESVNMWDYPQKRMSLNQKQELYEMATNYHEVMESGKCQWWRETYAAAEEMFQEQFGTVELTFIPNFEYSIIEKYGNAYSHTPADPYMKKFYSIDMKGLIENEYGIDNLY